MAGARSLGWTTPPARRGRLGDGVGVDAVGGAQSAGQQLAQCLKLIIVEAAQHGGLDSHRLRQVAVEHRSACIGDRHEDLASVFGVGLALHQSALLEAVDHRGHRPARQVEMLADLVRRQRVIRPLEHRQGLGRRQMQAMDAKATVDRVDQHVAESDQIAHRLVRPRAPARELGSERFSRVAVDEAAVRAKLERHWEYSGADEDVAHEIYHDDAVLEFPQSGERFEGVDNFREWRRQYPAQLAFEIRRIRGRGDLWVAENSIRYDDGPWNLTISILEFRGEKVAREAIYITQAWEPPAWRAPWRAAP
jgi:hypothetical protein